MLIEGVFAAVTTPFYPDERIYFRKVEANMSRYSRSLLAGVVVLGSTGEAPMLTDAETRDVLRAAAEATAPEKVLIAGIGRDSVKATVDLAEVAAEQKYDVFLFVPRCTMPDRCRRRRSCTIFAAWPTARLFRFCSTTFQVRPLSDSDRGDRRTGRASPNIIGIRIPAAAWTGFAIRWPPHARLCGVRSR